MNFQKIIKTTAKTVIPMLRPKRSMFFSFFGPFTALGLIGSFAAYKAYRDGAFQNLLNARSSEQAKVVN